MACLPLGRRWRISRSILQKAGFTAAGGHRLRTLLVKHWATRSDSIAHDNKLGLRVSVYLLANLVSCDSTHCHRPCCFTKTSVARSCVVKGCPPNFPLVVVSAVTIAVFP